MIRSCLVYVFVGLFILLAAPPAMLWSLCAGHPRLLYRLARFCIRVAGWIAGIRTVVYGRENILPERTYVFLSNHRSNCDGPVLCHVIPRDCRALVKKEMMRLPVLSLVLKQARFVPIERLNPKTAQKAIELGAERLRDGGSFFAFPEGTRSRDGSLGEFKKGVFIMAIKAQTPIMPVTILGSEKIQPPGRFAIRPGTVRVIFHDPISTQGMTLEDRNRLIRLTRQAIASDLPG